MKIIPFAFTNWGLKGVETLISKNHEVPFVFTHPLTMDKNENVWFDSINELCNKNGIPIKETISLNNDDKKLIKELNPDLIISLNWRRLLPSSIYRLPPKGTINIHAGYLPKYRGFAPINWAIINGETEIAVTSHYIDETVDTGDIVFQKKIDVSLNETAYDVYEKALLSLPEVVNKSVLQIESGTVKPISQKNLKGFLCVKRFPEDGQINWKLNRIQIYNLIRALSDPFPNAFFYNNNEKIFIKKAELIEDDIRGPPGRVYRTEDGIIVTCGYNHKENQALLITEISVKEKTMNPKEYFTKLWHKLE